jgi:hypothetical protein
MVRVCLEWVLLLRYEQVWVVHYNCYNKKSLDGTYRYPTSSWVWRFSFNAAYYPNRSRNTVSLPPLDRERWNCRVIESWTLFLFLILMHVVNKKGFSNLVLLDLVLFLLCFSFQPVSYVHMYWHLHSVVETLMLVLVNSREYFASVLLLFFLTKACPLICEYCGRMRPSELSAWPSVI